MKFNKEQIKDLIYLKENNGCKGRKCAKCLWGKTNFDSCWFQNQPESVNVTSYVPEAIQQVATIVLKKIIFEEQK